MWEPEDVVASVAETREDCDAVRCVNLVDALVGKKLYRCRFMPRVEVYERCFDYVFSRLEKCCLVSMM